MFNFFKKKQKPIKIECYSEKITIDNKEITFPTNFNTLIDFFGEPSREFNGGKDYLFWDKLGVFCGCIDRNEILSLSFYQNKKDKNKYNTKNQFKGELFFNNEEITNNEFDKIQLGKVAIHRLGSESETRYGFSIGLNNYA